jgi:hypothetical protein
MEATAVGLPFVALAACCFTAGLRRPHAGRNAATILVSVVAVLTIVFAAQLLVVGEPENPDSIAGPVGSVFLVLGLLIAFVAAVVQFGGELGRWLVAAVLTVLGSLLLWASVSESVEDRAGGSMIVLLTGLSFIASSALLAGGSNVASRSSGRPVPDRLRGFPLRP